MTAEQKLLAAAERLREARVGVAAAQAAEDEAAKALAAAKEATARAKAAALNAEQRVEAALREVAP